MQDSNSQLPSTIDGVIDRLEEIIQESIQNRSRMGYFAALYKRVTVSVKNKIEQGYFDDNERMEKLDVIFANRYLAAYDAYQSNQSCSQSWKLAFDVSKWWSPLVIQHLFVGMNAHIGLDLGIAAAEVQPENIESLHDDFNKINEVLGDLVDKVEDELASIFPLLKPIDWLAGGIDEKIAKFAMGIARDEAWKVAVAYTEQSTPAAKEEYIIHRDIKVTGFSNKIVNPGAFIKFIIRIFRGLEIGNVRSKIQKLNR